MAWVLRVAALSMVLAGCVQMLGGERSVEGDERECDGDGDCDDDEGCDDDICRKKCFEDVECGPFRSCSGRYCSDPVGTPCDPEDYLSFDCYGTYNCETVDSANDDVLGYCTVGCSTDMLCPQGYTCVDSTCLVNH